MARWLRAVSAVAARHGDAELYDQFKAQMQKAKSPEQYYRYFYALAEFPQAAADQADTGLDADPGGARPGPVHPDRHA